MTDLRSRLQEGLHGTYTIERELGRGGMATVYLAHDLRHDRPVALKLLHPELAVSLGPDRFQREIRLAARLQHPHILPVLDSGNTDGRLWFTMPFVEGESLRDRLRRERQLPVEDALRVAGEAAQALHYAHEHGIIHRDVKPENLLLTRDGNTLVADFGIARALSGGSEERLTETGLAVGTPAYMSPEQAAGDKTLDARTDIYSLAAVLYECLAGEPPYNAVTTQAMLVKRLTEPPPSARAARSNVPEGVDEAIRKALSPVAADRYATMLKFGSALQASSRPTSASPTPAAQAATAAVPTLASAVGPRRSRKVPVAALTLVLGLLIGVGALFAWRRGHPGDERSGDERRIAVLPFQNLGDSSDAYFADGITDAVRGKLTVLPGMRVTASNSSSQYRGTSKTPQEIGRELGVDYLLIGKVRWQKGAGSASRVQVSPELIEVASADAKWQQPFDASLTDVFQVQADIAGRVAQALDVAIGSRQQQVLAERPTTNLAAYDAYLKGKALASQGGVPEVQRQAAALFEQAVALDSTFVEAWVALSRANSLAYGNGTHGAVQADRARAAADRALALDPNFPGSYIALGNYYRLVVGSTDRAVEQYRKGLALAPGDADLLRAMGIAEQSQGQWDRAVEHLQESWRLDPRRAPTASVLGDALLWRRRYDSALHTLDQCLALNPSSVDCVQSKAMVFLARGDLAGARAILAEPPAGTDMPAFVAYVAKYWDMYWALNADQLALVKRLRPDLFDGDVGSWGLAIAGIHQMQGNRRAAVAYADSARVALEQQLTVTPDDPQRLVLLGVALAYLGRKDEAIRAGERGVGLEPVASNAQNGPYFQLQLARIYVLVGEQEKALDTLEPLLKIPYYLSPGWLRIDPTFDPLRKNPRFQRLVEGTA